jgi:hypothetical protein
VIADNGKQRSAAGFVVHQQAQTTFFPLPTPTVITNGFVLSQPRIIRTLQTPHAVSFLKAAHPPCGEEGGKPPREKDVEQQRRWTRREEFVYCFFLFLVCFL